VCINGEMSDAYYEMKGERDNLAEDNVMLKVKVNAMRKDARWICSQKTLTEFLTTYPKETL
jgi:hypothetical protein